MSAFWIFAVTVTAAYVVYYTVIICIDLYRKPKDQSHENEESFEIDQTPSEESKAVEETDGGFRVASDGGNGWDETEISHPGSNEPAEQSDEVKLDATGAPMTPAQQKIEAASNDMEEIETEMTGELMDLAFKDALSSGNPPVAFERPVKEPVTNKNDEDNHAEKTDQTVSQIRDKI